MEMQQNCSKSLFVALAIYFLQGLSSARFAIDAAHQSGTAVDIFPSDQEFASWSRVPDSVLDQIKHFFLMLFATEFFPLYFSFLSCFVCH